MVNMAAKAADRARIEGLQSHFVNRSLAKGRVQEAFKVGKVFPVFKGKGKPPEDPSSYRPVLILPALSKVLESSVKADLEKHLAKVNGLSNAQHGFRPRRSCTTAPRRPGGSPEPRGGRSLALWPLTCPPPFIQWRLSSYSQNSNC
jgi:hypothetical protein